ncbi:MAG: phage tail protein [Candidatus Paceibacteria bacterium]
MAFNVTDFQQQGLLYGGARPALFQVDVTPPAALGLDLTSARKFEFTCRAANLPESNIDSIQIPYFGRKIKIAGDRTFPDWTVTIMNDEDFGVRAMFEKWSNSINRLRSNTRAAGLDLENYMADFTVTQFGKDGEIIRAYLIQSAFPTNVAAIDLDWDSTNAIETFNVTLAYTLWEPVVEISSKIAGGINQYAGDL